MNKTAAKISALVAVIALSFYVAIVKYRAAKGTPRAEKFNVLVLSFCSLRDDVLSFYNLRAKPLSPNIEKFFAPGAHILENAINPNPWTTLFHYQSKRWFREPVNQAGFEVIGAGTKGYTRIPARKGRIGEEKDYAQALSAFRDEVLRERKGPFMAVSHITYMHYPRIDRVNADSGWDRFLSEAEKQRLDSYLRAPENFPEKLPLLLILTGDVSLAGKNKKTAALYANDKRPERLLGLVANPELISAWKASPDFAEDAVILKKVYEANAAYMDKFIADALNLWGDKELQKNTIVVLTGDHGEMNMDHGELTHATALYDRALRFPFLVRIPSQMGGVVRLPGQVQLSSAALMLKNLMNGELSPLEIGSFLKAQSEPVLILRDCANKLRGLRFENKWKYIVRMADGAVSLYDLEKDPEEANNLAPSMPAKVTELEKLYWANYERFANLPTRKCAPGAAKE